MLRKRGKQRTAILKKHLGEKGEERRTEPLAGSSRRPAIPHLQAERVPALK
jgi:hypothetical protein